jgi:heat shock protein HslJ
MRTPTIIAALATALLAATPLFAQTAPDTPMGMAPAIIGSTWTAIEINGTAPSNRLSTFKITEEMKAVGKGGCNNWSAPILLEGTDIRIGDIKSTMMACPGGVMVQERAYFAALAAAKSWQAADGELRFLDAEGTVLIRFSI